MAVLGKDKILRRKKMSIVVYEEFKGQQILKIKNAKEDNFPQLSFGKVKAKLILEHLEEIKKFAGEEPKTL
jgi:hypothetical protein